MAQSDDSIRHWQQTRDKDAEEESSSSEESRSPLSLTSETVPSLQEDSSNHGTPIHHPQFTNNRENLGNKTTNGLLVKPIPVHATLDQSEQRLSGGSVSERETSSENNENGGSKLKRVLSTNQLSHLSYKTTDVPSPESATTQPMPKKRMRFMSIDEILTTAKQNDTHYVSPSFALESVEELDHQLGEELKSTAFDKKTDGIDHAFSNPSSTIALSATATASPRVSPVCVPLLTPPQSPRHSIVEWPSNLVIESALMSVANEIRPLSPASLTGEDVVRMETTGDATTGDGTSNLTTRLSFITVGSN